MARIKLEIVTPDKAVLNEEVDEVVVPGIEGQFGVLPGHTTFLSAMGAGSLTYTKGGVSQSLEISGGFAEVRQNQVMILADITLMPR